MAKKKDFVSLKRSVNHLKRNLLSFLAIEDKTAKIIRRIEKTKRKIETNSKILRAAGIDPDVGSNVTIGSNGEVYRTYKTYDNYSDSSVWRGRREEYYKHHEKKCTACGATGGDIQLHHRTYVRIGSELDEDLMPLCGRCHRCLHFFQKEAGLPVEDATSFWVTAVNKIATEGLPKGFSFSRFKEAWFESPPLKMVPIKKLDKALSLMLKKGPEEIAPVNKADDVFEL